MEKPARMDPCGRINDKGEKVNWHFELPSPNTLMRRGWTRDS
jgi:hypothetical protein